MRSALLLVGWMMLLAYWLASPSPEAAVDLPASKWDEHLLDLEQQAIETAFSRQIGLLYENWMKDYARNEPQRVANGARKARHAYVRAMTKIEERRASR